VLSFPTSENDQAKKLSEVFQITLGALRRIYDAWKSTPDINESEIQRRYLKLTDDEVGKLRESDLTDTARRVLERELSIRHRIKERKLLNEKILEAARIKAIEKKEIAKKEKELARTKEKEIADANMPRRFGLAGEKPNLWSCQINFGDSESVRTNYHDLCEFAKRVRPGFRMFIEHGKLNGEDVLAIIYPLDFEDDGFPDNFEYQTINGWMSRKGHFATDFGYLHSFYSGTERLSEYLRGRQVIEGTGISG